MFLNNGVPEPYLFDLSLCLIGSADPIYGACCDDSTGVCADGVEIADCTSRFAANTSCFDLAPLCGNAGACCNDDTGVCVDDVLENAIQAASESNAIDLPAAMGAQARRGIPELPRKGLAIDEQHGQALPGEFPKSFLPVCEDTTLLQTEE